METEVVGRWHIVKDRTFWVLHHEYTSLMGTHYNGIDGIFERYDIAKKAMYICKNDKPTWKFEITEHSLISDIWGDCNYEMEK